MSKHREDNCTVPFCSECLNRIKGVADIARGTVNSTLKDKETEKQLEEEHIHTKGNETYLTNPAQYKCTECGKLFTETKL